MFFFVSCFLFFVLSLFYFKIFFLSCFLQFFSLSFFFSFVPICSSMFPVSCFTFLFSFIFELFFNIFILKTCQSSSFLVFLCRGGSWPFHLGFGVGPSFSWVGGWSFLLLGGGWSFLLLGGGWSSSGRLPFLHEIGLARLQPREGGGEKANSHQENEGPTPHPKKEGPTQTPQKGS